MKVRLGFLFLAAAVVFFAVSGTTHAVNPDSSSIATTIDTEVAEIFMYSDYERIVMTPLSNLSGSQTPNWRELYLAKAKNYEDFLKKYPGSPLEAEVKLRIAELWRDMDRIEIYAADVLYYQCLNDRARTREQENCTGFEVKKRRDPVYMKKSADLMLELVRDYGHVRRYALLYVDNAGNKPHFEWVDEEIGAQALYFLSMGADPLNQKRILLRIQSEYKAGKRLQEFIAKDLEKLKDVKVK